MKKNVLLFVTLLSTVVANGQVHYAKHDEGISLRRNTNVSSHDQEIVSPLLKGDFRKTMKAGDSCILSFEVADIAYQLSASDVNPEINGNAYDALPSTPNTLRYLLFTQHEAIDSEFSAIIEAKDNNGNSISKKVVVTIEATGKDDFMMERQDFFPSVHTDSIRYQQNATISFLPDSRYRTYMEGVNFYVNDQLIYTDHSLPYEVPKEFTNTLADGCYTFTAKPFYTKEGTEKKIATRNIVLVKSSALHAETKLSLRVYPNPVIDKVSILTLGNNVEAVQLRTMQGVSVPLEYTTESSNVVVDTEALQIPAGIYILEVLSNGRWITSKVIKQ